MGLDFELLSMDLTIEDIEKIYEYYQGELCFICDGDLKKIVMKKER